ncbi:MAG: outer membrane protein assembly factor BamD [Bacteroidales bacterium]
MKKKINILLLLVVSTLIFGSCKSRYQTVLESTDYEYKFKVAKEYYDQGDYARSGELFKDVLNAYRGTSKMEEVYYYYAYSCFNRKMYLLANQHFRMLFVQNPQSQYAEEAMYLAGYSLYELSPSVRLEQSITQECVDAMELFINAYPNSRKVNDARNIIAEMQDKLVDKSYLSAELYYNMERYKASVIAIKNSLKEYPNTKYREKMMYMLVKAAYLYADNSVPEQQAKRMSMAMDEYFAFVDEFPNSQYRKELDKYESRMGKWVHVDEEDLQD